MRKSEIVALGRTLLSDALDELHGSWDPFRSLDIALAMLEWERISGDSAEPVAHFRLALEALPQTGRLRPWLYGGAAQIGWLALQIRDRKGVSLKNLSAIDDFIVSWVESYPETADVELVCGILGLGVYGLRHSSPAIRRQIVDGVLRVVDSRVEIAGDGAFVRLVGAPWERPETTGEIGWRSVGVAHGNAGVVAFLALVTQSRTENSQVAQRLLARTAIWMTMTRLDAADIAYPAYVEQPSPRHRGSWCHGDPGVSLALAQACDSLKDGPIRASVRECAARAAQVTLGCASGNAGIADCCVCHGAAFLCYFGRRWGEFSGDATDHYVSQWLRHIAGRRSRGPLRYRRPDGLRRDISFLSGDCGVACALWRCASGTRASWEDLLLMSS
jgi:lantibiotic biosynthesis protein